MRHKYIKLAKCELGTIQDQIKLWENHSWYLSIFPFPEFNAANLGLSNPDLTDKYWCGGVWSKDIPFVKGLAFAFSLIQN